ncbi:MAG: hypothetical protein V6Z82_02485 [Flavobacteriales bacterium]
MCDLRYTFVGIGRYHKELPYLLLQRKGIKNAIHPGLLPEVWVKKTLGTGKKGQDQHTTQKLLPDL